jgi:hypothetical protein
MLLPDLQRELVRAAAERQQKKRWRARALVGLAVAIAVGTPTAIATTGLFGSEDVATGPVPTSTPSSAGDYTVRAVYRGEAVCLAIDIRIGKMAGRPATCEPSPIRTPLHQIMITVIGDRNERLLTGIASPEVTRVDAEGTEDRIALRRFDRLPGSYFSVLVKPGHSVRLSAVDTTGQQLATFDSSSLGPIGRGSSES